MVNSTLVEEPEVHHLPREAVIENRDLGPFESRLRSFAKALSWRVIAFMIIVGIVWVATGKVSFAAGVGIADALLKIGFYYLHERAWNRFKVGRKDARKSARITRRSRHAGDPDIGRHYSARG